MKKDLATSILIILVCGILVRQAMALPAPRFEPLGPSFFPLFVLYSVVALSAVNILMTLWKMRAGHQPIAVEGDARPWQLTLANVMPLVSIVTFAAFALLISYTTVPFVFLAFGFVVLLSWTMASFRVRALPAIVVVATVLAGTIQWIFVDALNLVLP